MVSKTRAIETAAQHLEKVASLLDPHAGADDDDLVIIWASAVSDAKKLRKLLAAHSES